MNTDWTKTDVTLTCRTCSAALVLEQSRYPGRDARLRLPEHVDARDCGPVQPPCPASGMALVLVPAT